LEVAKFEGLFYLVEEISPAMAIMKKDDGTMSLLLDGMGIVLYLLLAV